MGNESPAAEARPAPVLRDRDNPDIRRCKSNEPASYLFEEESRTQLHQGAKDDYVNKLLHSNSPAPRPAQAITNFLKRQQTFQQNKESKVASHLQRKREEALNGCTFHPNDKLGGGRNLKQFLNDQQSFLMKKQQSIGQIRESYRKQIKQLQTSKPAVNARSSLLAQSKIEKEGLENCQLHERLYNYQKHKPKRDSSSPKRKQKQNGLQSSGLDVGTRLYNRAKQRTSKSKQTGVGQKQLPSKVKSRRYLAQKLRKELWTIKGQLGYEDELSYVEAGQVLIGMHFLSLETQVSSHVFMQERAQFNEAWLIAEEDNRVSAENLLILVFAIMRLDYHQFYRASLGRDEEELFAEEPNFSADQDQHERVQPFAGSELDLNLGYKQQQEEGILSHTFRREQAKLKASRIGKALVFDKGQIRLISLYFDVFYINKLNRDKGYSEVLNSLQTENLQEKSLTRALSWDTLHRDRLASRHRKNVYNQAVAGMLVKEEQPLQPLQPLDYYQLEHKLHQLKLSNIVEEKTRQQEQMLENSKSLNRVMSADQQHFLKLYELSTLPKQPKHQTQEEMELQACTHHPDTGISKKKPARQHVVSQKQVEKFVKRISEARVERKKKEAFLARGEGQPGLVKQSRPLVYVDVNYGEGKIDRLVLRKGDSADKLTEEFARKHRGELKLGDKEKLLTTLQSLLEGKADAT